MPTLTISQSGMQHLLSTTDVQKVSGPDLISLYILKHCANEIAPILQVIYTQSLSTSSLPTDWLSANICPVFKRDNHSSPSNYLPKSLTSISAKTLNILFITLSWTILTKTISLFKISMASDQITLVSLK